MASEYTKTCRHCGLPVVIYYFGWKHHPGPGRKVPWEHKAEPKRGT